MAPLHAVPLAPRHRRRARHPGPPALAPHTPLAPAHPLPPPARRLRGLRLGPRPPGPLGAPHLPPPSPFPAPRTSHPSAPPHPRRSPPPPPTLPQTDLASRIFSWCFPFSGATWGVFTGGLIFVGVVMAFIESAFNHDDFPGTTVVSQGIHVWNGIYLALAGFTSKARVSSALSSLCFA